MSYLICPTFSNASQLFCFVSSALFRLQSLPIDSKICIKSQKAPGNICSSGAEGILHTSMHSVWLFLIEWTLFPFKGRLGFFKGYPSHQTFLAVNRECMHGNSVWEEVCFVRGTACISFLIFTLQIAVQHITRGLFAINGIHIETKSHYRGIQRQEMQREL